MCTLLCSSHCSVIVSTHFASPFHHHVGHVPWVAVLFEQSPWAASTYLHGSCRPLLVSFRTLASLLLLKVFLFLERGRKHQCLFLCLFSFLAEKKYGMTHVYNFLICGQCFSFSELISMPQAALEFSFVFYFSWDCIVWCPRFRN